MRALWYLSAFISVRLRSGKRWRPKGEDVRNVSTTRCEGRRSGSACRHGGAVGVVTAIVLALATASPAWANPSASATLAPIGTGSYLLHLTNTGNESITSFIVVAGEEPLVTNVVPSPACHYGSSPVTGSITCTVTVPPAASTEMCYTGHALEEFIPGDSVLVNGSAGTAYSLISSAPAVASCPLPGFNAGSGSTGSGSGAKCVVPNLKGKALAAAEKAISQAHCAVGKVKKASSSHVKKGRVISQSPAAGKSLPKGTKVSLVVSKG